MKRLYQKLSVLVVVVAVAGSVPAASLGFSGTTLQENGNAGVTFDDQTSDGTSVTVTSATSGNAPFYVAVWTIDDSGTDGNQSDGNATDGSDGNVIDGNVTDGAPTPGTLLGFTQVNGTSASDISVDLSEAPIDESQTLIAAVHPDQDGDASTVDPNVSRILAFDTANVTVEETPSETGDESFEVSDLRASGSVSAGVPVVVTATVSNPGNASSTQVVDYRFDGTVEGRQLVSLDAGEQTTVRYTLETDDVAPGQYSHGVFTRDDGQTAALDVSGVESFVVQDLSADVNWTVGETVTATALVQNPNNATETKPVHLRFNGERLSTENVTLGPNEVTELTFSVPTDDRLPGLYFLGVFTPDRGDVSTVVLEEPGPSANETATVSFTDQESDGRNVTVDSVSLPDGGFVAVHDISLLDGDAVGSVVGVSEYVGPGNASNVSIELFDVPGAVFLNESLPANETTTLIAMPHRDTNDNETYDFVRTDGTADGPYLDENGSAVVDAANVTVNETASSPEEQPDVYISRVIHYRGTTEDPVRTNTVVVRTTANETVSLDGWYVGSDGTYVQLSGNASVGPSESHVVHWNQTGTDTANSSWTGTGVGDLSEIEDEVVLLRPGAQPDEGAVTADSVVSYVKWDDDQVYGNDGVNVSESDEPAAITAGVWNGSFVDTTDVDFTEQVLTLVDPTVPGGGADDWEVRPRQERDGTGSGNQSAIATPRVGAWAS